MPHLCTKGLSHRRLHVLQEQVPELGSFFGGEGSAAHNGPVGISRPLAGLVRSSSLSSDELIRRMFSLEVLGIADRRGRLVAGLRLG